MVNSDTRYVNTNENRETNTLSVILATQAAETPLYQSPDTIKGLIPQNILYEIIVIHYNQDHVNNPNGSIDVSEIPNENKTKLGQPRIIQSDQPTHAYMQGQFAVAVLKGIEMSCGRFILVIDADFPYPTETLGLLAKELINSSNSIIIASRYAKGSSLQRLPFVRSTISKGARMIVQHGLKIRNVKDPLSSCFGLSREHLKGIQIEGTGHDILLEILVKVNSKTQNKTITVKEIPFIQRGIPTTRKLDFNRILSYSKAVWHLYLYGRKFKQAENPSDVNMQEKHKSVLFLSKAGRFFTVGASGFVVNYVVSFLLTNVVLNVWYIQATLFGILISITTNFLLNKVWTFEDTDFSVRHFFKQYLSFLGLCTLGAVIQLSLVFVFVEYSHIQYGISLIMAVCVASLGNFLLNKKITFGETIWG